MDNTFLVFDGARLLARGTPAEIIPHVNETLKVHPGAMLLTFEAATGRQTELDLRPVEDKTAAKASAKSDPAGTTGPGRPKLGVVGREVTLLPRHWEWLGAQPGGASIALRKLVEQAMKSNREADGIRQRQEAAYRFMSAMAGNLPGYEEAIRALFAGDEKALKMRVKDWPQDVRAVALELALGENPAAE